MNISLIGMPGVGKSTVGVVLAKIMGYGFIDTDLLIQKRENALLCDIIDTRGVDGFIAAESAAISELVADRCVIATGGSAVYGDAAMQNLRALGKIVYLRVGYDALSSRLSDIRHRGVVLREGETLRDIFDSRAPLYERYADFTVDEDGSLESTVDKIVEYIRGL